jgi:broad-specificity NMP kinase
MKNIFLIGGTMGVGKTTTCQIMKDKLSNSVFLDGDWCWDMRPFQVTEETKEMVMRNICFLLNNFIKCTVYENIVFCWVMHQQALLMRLFHVLIHKVAKCISYPWYSV